MLAVSARFSEKVAPLAMTLPLRNARPFTTKAPPAERLPAMVAASLRSGFGLAKASALPDCCRECDVLAACRGGCPKHRFTGTLRDEPGLNYLCEGYRKFFRHSRKYLQAIVQLLALDLPPEYVMKAIGQPLVIPASEKTGKKDIVLWIK